MAIETRLKRLESLAARLRSEKAEGLEDAETERYFRAMSPNDLVFLYRAALHSSWEELSPEDRERLEALTAPIDHDGGLLRALQNPPASPITPDMHPARATELFRGMLR